MVGYVTAGMQCADSLCVGGGPKGAGPVQSEAHCLRQESIHAVPTGFRALKSQDVNVERGRDAAFVAGHGAEAADCCPLGKKGGNRSGVSKKCASLCGRKLGRASASGKALEALSYPGCDLPAAET